MHFDEVTNDADRILCWELVSKRGCKWKLHYVKSAYAITDVPDQVPELVSQRRRSDSCSARWRTADTSDG